MAGNSSQVTDSSQPGTHKESLKIGIAIALTGGLFIAGAIGFWTWLFSSSSPSPVATDSSTFESPKQPLSSNSQEHVNPINQIVMIEQWEVTILRIDMEGRILGKAPLEKRALGQWVLISLNARNLSDRTDSLSAQYFKLTDSQGRIYEVSSEGSYEMAVTGNSNYIYDDVPPDVSSRIVLAFDVAPGAHDFTLVVRTGEGIENIALYDFSETEANSDSGAAETRFSAPSRSSSETVATSTPSPIPRSTTTIAESPIHILETENFRVTLTDDCTSGQLPCDVVSYRGLNLSNGDTLTLDSGTLINACQNERFPCSGASYEFRNGNYRYVVTGEGYLQVYRGTERLLSQAGRWKTDDLGTQRIVHTEAGYANLRNAPTAESGVLIQVANGTSVKVLDETRNTSGYVWYQVETNGKVGWLYSELLY